VFQRTLIALLLGTALFAADHSYLGFDRNEYPGDENLAALHERFRSQATGSILRQEQTKTRGKENAKS